MEIIKYKNHQICYDDQNLDEKQDLKEFLKEKDYEWILDKMTEKTVLVLGGDGTMLKSIRRFYKEDFLFLGINFGGKGFLLNSKNFLKKNFNYVERIYPLLEIEKVGDGEHKSFISTNEIDIRAGEGKMINLDIYLSVKQKINIEGDGLIIATPAGSTGYNSSLGGPVIPHTIKAFVLTPKAPWKPKRQSSIIINDTEIINIKNTGRKNKIEIYCDGKLFLDTQTEEDLDILIKKSKKEIRLLILSDYINIWDNKVLQEQGFQI